jgi:pimeloyl-ACP methyl ester carboxylesterase
MSAAVQEQWLTLGPGRRLRLWLAGTGPLVLYLPGNECDSADALPLLPYLANQYRLAMIDPPGRASAEWPDEAFDFHQLAALVAQALGDLADQPQAVIGHSMGGMLAYHYARHQGGRVLGLACIEGFTTLGIHRSLVNQKGFGPVRMAEALRQDFLTRRAANRAWMLAHPRFDASFWPSQQSHDARPFAAALGIPILTLVGDLGQPLPVTGNDWRQRLGLEGVVACRAAAIPKVGHWAHLDDPDSVGPLLRRFLASLAWP